MTDLKFAWRTAVILRTCPPKRIFFDQDNKGCIENHIERCPFCPEISDQSEDLEAWDELGQILKTMVKVPEVKTPEPGQIWSIHQDLEGWDVEYRYFNSPLILVTEVNKNLQAIKGAQLYPDTTLMGSEDVYLGDSLGFAQAWNIYTLAFEDLGYCWQKIDLSLIDKVKEISQTGCQEIEANSTLYFFRQLEMEVGAFFSLPSIEKIMTRIEQPESTQDIIDLYPWLKDFNRLSQVLHREHPGIDLDKGKNDPFEILALMSPPEDELAMAASSVTKLIVFNLVFIAENRVNVQSKQAVITHSSVVEDQGWISGYFVERQEMLKFLVWWKKDKQQLIKADDVKFDQKYFRAYFSEVETDFFDSGSLILLGLYYDLEY